MNLLHLSFLPVWLTRCVDGVSAVSSCTGPRQADKLRGRTVVQSASKACLALDAGQSVAQFRGTFRSLTQIHYRCSFSHEQALAATALSYSKDRIHEKVSCQPQAPVRVLTDSKISMSSQLPACNDRKAADQARDNFCEHCGWGYANQMLLKLLLAAHVRTEFYITLDADVLLRKALR